MRIALVVSGSRGDVQPFVCLGRALADAGEDVEVVAPLNGERMIQAAGLAYRPFPLDAQELLGAEDGQRMLADGRLGPFFRWVESVERPYWEANRQVLIEAGREADMLVCGILTVARCEAVAEANGIPLVPLHLCPIAPSRTYMSPLLTQRKLGPLKRLSHDAAFAVFYRSQRDDLARLHEELGLAPPSWSRWRRGLGADAPCLLGYSQALFPAPADWSPALRPAGFLEPWPELRVRLGEAGIPNELEAWLAAGPPPVFFGFGSMPVLDEHAMLTTIRKVSTELGVRAIVGAGWSELASAGDENLYVVDAIDHQSLLPRCAAAVHHGGAGTTAASTRAGIPTLVCSVLADQPFWGARCRALGIGDTIAFKRLDARRLHHSLRRILDVGVRERAREVARRMAGEDGVATAREHLVRAPSAPITA